jgi:hypothetical protein
MPKHNICGHVVWPLECPKVLRERGALATLKAHFLQTLLEQVTFLASCIASQSYMFIGVVEAWRIQPPCISDMSSPPYNLSGAGVPENRPEAD